MYKTVLITIFLIFCLNIQAHYRRHHEYKTVVVEPRDAEIYVNNELLGKGTCNVSFSGREKVLLTFKCNGYETATYSLLRSNLEQTVTYRLEQDEAFFNSDGEEYAAQYANKWVPIVPRAGLADDDVWRRMISIITTAGFALEKTDRSSGWIKTFPSVKSYKTSDVRTTLEVLPDYSTGEKQYKVRLNFERRQKGRGEEGWVKYNRLMKDYKDVIPDLINSLGGGM